MFCDLCWLLVAQTVKCLSTMRETWVRSLGWEDSLEKEMATHSVLLPGKSHGWRSLVGCSPWGCQESDTTERLHFHFSLSWTGEGNGNPLQCSCLENSRDGGAWWAAVYGVTQSWTRLKQLSSSSSSILSSIVAVSIYIPTSSARLFPFLHTLSSIYCL